jgi:hypothetical protein
VNKSMLSEISKLRNMSVGQLRDEWFRLYGQATASRNRDYLWRRLAWRVQELALGGLSDRAKARIAELASDGFTRARIPAAAGAPRDNAPTAEPTPTPRTVRDRRLPSPGTVISRSYHGRELRLLVLDDGFELDGTRYGSLSEAARAITGQHWNGRLFFGLVQRRRKA